VVLQIEGLTFHYPQRELFTGLSARIATGVTLVTGGDGAGKTTLLRLLAGDLKPQAGRVDCQPPVFWTDPKSTAFDQMTVAAYFNSLRPRYSQFDDQALAELIEVLSLADHQHKPLYMLSAGSKRKDWLAAGFASGAAVTLLDEPFAALDVASINIVIELLAEAASLSARTWVLAGYEAPRGVPLAATIDLGS
jgi:ABC-type multidrug transport system ATPase subunit